jgi:hypothetical protein
MGHSSKHTNRASKRAQFDTGKQASAKPKLIIGAAIAILAVLLGYLVIAGGATDYEQSLSLSVAVLD